MEGRGLVRYLLGSIANTFFEGSEINLFSISVGTFVFRFIFIFLFTTLIMVSRGMIQRANLIQEMGVIHKKGSQWIISQEKIESSWRAGFIWVCWKSFSVYV